MRGYWAPTRLSQIENVEIKALCDLEFKWNQKEKLKKMLPLADLYSEKEDWKKEIAFVLSFVISFKS